MKRMLSGIKPTGRLTLGNYIGAISQFVQYQNDYELFIFIANQHAITVHQEPKVLRQNTKDLVALYLASGLDPEKVNIFLQTDVPAHAQLGWVMTCLAYMGELSRMTQYKAKLESKETNLTDGLFTYPCLMAADILLYDADYVPVGIDQKQHVELTRDLAERFNHRYSDTFVMPEPLMSEVGQKIYSLQDPTKKMSKSEENPKGTIDLLDPPSQAKKKILSAVTDSIGIIQYDPINQPGLANLLTIEACLSHRTFQEVVEQFKNEGYATLKQHIGKTVEDFLTDLQAKYHQVIESGVVKEVLEQGSQKANYIANKKVRKVYQKMGLALK